VFDLIDFGEEFDKFWCLVVDFGEELDKFWFFVIDFGEVVDCVGLTFVVSRDGGDFLIGGRGLLGGWCWFGGEGIFLFGTLGETTLADFNSVGGEGLVVFILVVATKGGRLVGIKSGEIGVVGEIGDSREGKGLFGTVLSGVINVSDFTGTESGSLLVGIGGWGLLGGIFLLSGEGGLLSFGGKGSRRWGTACLVEELVGELSVATEESKVVEELIGVEGDFSVKLSDLGEEETCSVEIWFSFSVTVSLGVISSVEVIVG